MCAVRWPVISTIARLIPSNALSSNSALGRFACLPGCRRPDLEGHAAVSSVAGAEECLTPGQGNVWLANIRATADSHTPLSKYMPILAGASWHVRALS
jgi:hypothetical protein